MIRNRCLTALLLGACALGACAHGGSAQSPLGRSAANFTYYTPTTRLNLVGQLTLLRCDPDGIVVASDLSLAASATPDTAAPFMLDGTSLRSAMQRRELAVDLYDNGTLRTVNTASTDRTGAVLVNVLKTVASIAGAVVGAGAPITEAGGAPPSSSPCNTETMDALHLVERLRDELARARASLPTSAPAEAEAIRARMELIAHQIAVLITTQLTVPVHRGIELGQEPQPEVRPIDFQFRHLARWLATTPAGPASCRLTPEAKSFFELASASCDQAARFVGLGYRISATDVAPAEDRIRRSPCHLGPREASAPSVPPETARECGRTIVMPRPARATVAIVAAADNIAARSPGETVAQAVVPVPQWGYATYLPVNVGRFQGRSVGYTFNAFGERRSFKWNSEATAENATAALAAASEAGSGIVDTARGRSDLERLTAENAELEARMANNRLRRCEQAILAGATTCE